jgi:hypothetical protein
MTTRDEFAGRVPDADKRREAARLWGAVRDLETERDNADTSAKDAVDAKYAPLYQEAREVCRKRLAELDALKAAESPTPEIDARIDAAERAWQDFPCSDLMTDEDDDGVQVLVLCALTGLPMFEDDAVLKDEDTGEVILKAALGVPLKGGDMEFVLGPEAEAKAA